MKRQRRPSEPALRLLRALMNGPADWRHGYDLTRETGVGAGTLYPLLDRWATQGLLVSEWRPSDTPGRPPRHAYRLTGAGQAYAQQWTQDAPPAMAAKPGLAT